MLQIIYLLLGLVLLLWIYHYSVARPVRETDDIPPIRSQKKTQSEQLTEIKEGFSFKGTFNKIRQRAEQLARDARQRAERLFGEARQRAEQLARDARERDKLSRQKQEEERKIKEAQERERIEKRNKLIAEWKEKLNSDFNMLELIPPEIRAELANEIRNAEKQKCLYYKNAETERKGKAKTIIDKLIQLMEKLPQSREEVKTLAFSTDIYNIKQPEIVNQLQQTLYGPETNFNKEDTTQFIKMLREYNHDAYDTSKCK